jgi:hypothetical protein
MTKTAKDVGGGSAPVPVQLLGSHVGQSSQQRTRLGELGGAELAGDAQVYQHGAAALVDQNVGRFDIAMHHTRVVQRLKAIGEVGQHGGNRLTVLDIPQKGAQCVPFDVLQHGHQPGPSSNRS